MSSARAAREAGDVLALELLDLRGGGLPERRVEGIAAVELGGVDQERVRAVAEAAVAARC